MTAITENYNVKVNCRYYAFLQDGMESVDPDALIDQFKHKKEIEKENKTRAKKEKKNKVLPDKKDDIPESPKIEENKNFDSENQDQKSNEVIIDHENESDVNKEDRNNRGRGSNYRRGTGGYRKNFNPRSDESENFSRRNQFERGRGRNNRPERNNDDFVRSDNNDEFGNYRGSTEHRRSGRGRGRGRGNGRTFQNDDNKEEDFPDQIGNFEDMQESGQVRRTDRGGRRFTRSRGGRDGRGGRFNPPNEFSDGGDQFESSEGKMGYFDSSQDRRPPFRGNRGGGSYRGNGGNFRRSNNRGGRRGGGRGGGEGFRRDDDRPDGFQSSEFGMERQIDTDKWPDDNEFSDGGDKFESGEGKIGYFESSQDRRPPFRGNRSGGQFRGSGGNFRRSNNRGGRRGGPRRGGEGFRRDNDRQDGFQSSEFGMERQIDTDKWPDFDDDGPPPDQQSSGFIDNQPVNEELQIQPAPISSLNFEPDVDFRKSNWGEIEDDHPIDASDDDNKFNRDFSTQKTMTLEEWKASQQAYNMVDSNMAGSNSRESNRKPNDGQDVFSGMEEYRKEVKMYEEHNQQFSIDNYSGSRHKTTASIPVAIRFSRSGGGAGASQLNNQGTSGNRMESSDYYSRSSGSGSFGNRGSSRGGGYRGRGGGGGGEGRPGRGGGGGGRFYQNNFSSAPFSRQQNQQSTNFTNRRGGDYANGNNMPVHQSNAPGSNHRGSRGIMGNQKMNNPTASQNINLGNEDEFPTLA